MNRIVAVHKDTSSASISAYKLDDGRVLSREEACQAANRGEIDGVATFLTRDGSEAIRSNRGQWDYSLDNLPNF